MSEQAPPGDPQPAGDAPPKASKAGRDLPVAIGVGVGLGAPVIPEGRGTR